MKKLLSLGLTGCLLAAGVVAFASQALAAETPTAEAATKALAAKNLDSVQDMFSKNPQHTDELIKTILRNAQGSVAKDPEFTGKMMSLAGDFAEKITPPSVPAICADLRRVVEGIPLDQIGTPVFDQIMQASQKFSDAPVVVAQGRPNLCEEALLAQTPGMRAPNTNPLYHPPFNPINPVKPSAD